MLVPFSRIVYLFLRNCIEETMPTLEARPEALCQLPRFLDFDRFSIFSDTLWRSMEYINLHSIVYIDIE
jgi:hypothetical protein